LNQLTFDTFGLSEPIIRALRTENFITPTAIQQKAIPLLLEGGDLMAVAQTGTGKTAAYGLPLLEKLYSSRAPLAPKSVQALVLVPTRELAVQVHESLQSYGRHLKLRHAVIMGGVKLLPQIRQLAQGVHVLVATTGRLLDHLGEGHVRLDDVSMLVLDEADRMLDMGFINDVRKVAKLLPKSRQSAMFSATMAPEITKLANQILHDAKRVEIAPQGTTAERVTQSVIFVDKARKTRLLQQLLDDPSFSRTIIFTRTKRGADRVAMQVEKSGIVAEALHGNKSQNARQKALARFAAGKARVLVATDIAARGIDIDGVSHVINFELPDEAETYVHRIGRTARAGSEGIALSFCDVTERPNLRAIEKLTGKSLKIVDAGFGAEAEPAPETPKSRAPASKNKPAGGRSKQPAKFQAEAAPAFALIKKTAVSASGKNPATHRQHPAAKASLRAEARDGMLTGTVKWFNSQKGFGFVEPDGGGKDVFLHISVVERAGIGLPREGQKVSCDVERDQRGRASATSVRMAA
jgi:ATP-dependent RNA helicase RhlE